MLATASSEDSVNVLQILLQNGAKSNTVDDNENNLLHIATKYENATVLKYLIENTSLNLMDRNSKGETPMSIA